MYEGLCYLYSFSTAYKDCLHPVGANKLYTLSLSALNLLSEAHVAGSQMSPALKPMQK